MCCAAPEVDRACDRSDDASHSELEYLSELVRPGRVWISQWSACRSWGAVSGENVAVLTYARAGGGGNSAEVYESEVIVYERSTRKVVAHMARQANYLSTDQLMLPNLDYQLGSRTHSFGVEVKHAPHPSMFHAGTSSDTELTLYAVERGELNVVLDGFNTAEEFVPSASETGSPLLHVERRISIRGGSGLEFYPIDVAETRETHSADPACATNCSQSVATTYTLLHAGKQYVPEKWNTYREFDRIDNDTSLSNSIGSEGPWQAVPSARLRFKEVTLTSCGKFCGEFGGSFFEDTATGAQFDARYIFTLQGKRELIQKFKQSLLERAQTLVDAAIRDGRITKIDPYLLTQCRKNWNSLRNATESVAFGIDNAGHIVLSASACAWHIVGYDMLDNLTQSYSAQDLEPLLNAYGKSVLLGLGNVLQPGPEPLSCNVDTNQAKTLPHGGVAEMRSGGAGLAVLYNDGQLWVIEGHTDADTLQPIHVAGEFSHVEAFDGFIAALGRDGKLWARSRTQDGSSSADISGLSEITKIGDGFADFARVNFDSSVTLSKDGVVSLWKSEFVPVSTKSFKRVDSMVRVDSDARAVDVTPDGHILVVHSDGRLYDYDPTLSTKLPTQAVKPSRVPGYLLGYEYTGFLNRPRFSGRTLAGAVRRGNELWGWRSYGDTPIKLAEEVVQASYYGAPGVGEIMALLAANGALYADSYSDASGFLPIACGYTDVSGGESQDSSGIGALELLALKPNGELLAWKSKSNRGKRSSSADLFESNPVKLSDDVMTLPIPVLLSVNRFSLVGNVVLKTDGSMWIEYRSNDESSEANTSFNKLLDHVAVE